jgi:hypothetical protein
MRIEKFVLRDSFRIKPVGENDNLLELSMNPEIAGAEKAQENFDEMFRIVAHDDAEVLDD